MKKKLIMLAAALVLCGCATFGTFANLEKGKTTKEDVRSMLGEPENRLFEEDGEVWKYHFVKEDTEEPGRLRTMMDLAVIFKEGKVENYEVTVSKKAMQPLPPGWPSPPRRPIKRPKR